MKETAIRRDRTLRVYLATILLTAGVGTWMIVASLFVKNSNILHKAASIWAKYILAAGNIRVRTRDLAGIGDDSSYIFMSNHQSNIDIPVLLAHLKKQFRWVAKSELFSIPIFGLAMHKAGYISIDRRDRKSAFQSLNRAAQTIRNGTSVMIFPEGTRYSDGRIHPYKKGGFVLSVDSGVPIVPVILHGTDKIMPKGTFRVMEGEVLMELLTPVETADYTRKTKDRLLERIHDLMREAFEKNKGSH